MVKQPCSMRMRRVLAAAFGFAVLGLGVLFACFFLAAAADFRRPRAVAADPILKLSQHVS